MHEEYLNYIKPELIKDFRKECEVNSKDFYGGGCILTAHLVMSKLMKGLTPKEAWNTAMEQTPYHSGRSAAITATIVSRYSIRGKEFREWCIKDNVVMVDWT